MGAFGTADENGGSSLYLDDPNAIRAVARSRAQVEQSRKTANDNDDSTGGMIGGGIGAIIGAYVGGPSGALQGYQYGSKAGQHLAASTKSGRQAEAQDRFVESLTGGMDLLGQAKKKPEAAQGLQNPDSGLYQDAPAGDMMDGLQLQSEVA